MQPRVNVYRATDQQYVRIATWAQQQYQGRIHNTIGRFPDYLIAIERGREILGCIGLNEQIHCPLFQHDERCLMRSADYGPGACCEQSVLLVAENFPRALPILIAAVTFLAYQVGYTYLIYAGIKQSIKTINALGLHTSEIGPVDLSVLPSKAMQENYAPWYEANNPVYFALQTRSALLAQQRAIERYARNRVEVCQALLPHVPEPAICNNLVQNPTPPLFAEAA